MSFGSRWFQRSAAQPAILTSPPEYPTPDRKISGFLLQIITVGKSYNKVFSGLPSKSSALSYYIENTSIKYLIFIFWLILKLFSPFDLFWGRRSHSYIMESLLESMYFRSNCYYTAFKLPKCHKYSQNAILNDGVPYCNTVYRIMESRALDGQMDD